MDPRNREVASALRRKREAQNMTLQELAEKTGYTRGHLSQVETGKEPLNHKILAAYESALGLAEGSLYAETTNGNHDTTQAISALLTDIKLNMGKGNGEVDDLTDEEHAVEESGEVDVKGQVANGTVTEGVWKTLAAACHLLETAARMDPPANGQPILICLHSEAEAFGKQRRLHKLWRSLMIQVLNRGWNVMHVGRIASEREQIVKHIQYIVKNLLGRRGHYEPYYVKNSRLGNAPTYTIPDMLLVPGCGAMLFMATYQPEYVDSASIVTDAEQQKLMAQAFATGKARLGQLLQVFPRNSLAFEAILSRRETTISGDLLIHKDGLSTTLVPLSVVQAMIDRYLNTVVFSSPTEKEQRKKDLELLYLERKERRTQLYSRLEKYRVLHIANKQKLVRLLEERKVSADDWFLNTLPDVGDSKRGLLTNVEVVTCLQRLADLMDRYPNYELRLIEDDVTQEEVELFMEIVGSKTAMFEAVHPHGEGSSDQEQLDLEILEPTTIEALYGDFFNLWNQLPSDRKVVRDWINSLIRKFERL